MEIQTNILKHYLKNCYFINGTAYAGKSTMCKMLAEKYDMIHCEENYNMDMIMSIVTKEQQPNLSYFQSKASWQEYENWFKGTSREVAGFEIAELIRLSTDKKVIVDTNIPCDILKEISDYNHVVIMLSPQAMAVDKFFDRGDSEKQFLLTEIEKCPNPEESLRNFKECIAKINSQENHDEFKNSGFLTIIREDTEKDTREEVFEIIAKHFGLE